MSDIMKFLYGILAVVIVTLAALSLPVSADLPIHCLHAQITGTWKFTMTNNNHEHPYLCGYKTPDKSKAHFSKNRKLLEQYTEVLSPAKELVLELAEPNKVKQDGKEVGVWTMVYDEGFHVHYQEHGQQFFAFLYYSPKEHTSLSDIHARNYNSDCTRTLVGWYHGDDRRNWGCWTGKQTEAKYPNVDTVISNGVKYKKDYIVVSPNSMLEESSTAAYLQDPHSQQAYLSQVYTPDFSLIDEINNDVESTWSAGVHTPFLSRTNGEMLAMAGSSTFGKKLPRLAAKQKMQGFTHNFKSHIRTGALGKMKMKMGAGLSTNVHQDITNFLSTQELNEYGYPRNLDWRNVNGVNYVNEIRNQGSCGSCYAMAFMAAMEARIRIASNNKQQPNIKRDDFISPQYVLSCSVYNQGCDGGYPFLVGKHSEDFGVVMDSCMEYEASDSSCSSTCPKMYPIKNTRYVGSYYGACNEKAMMEEVAQGPVVVAYESPPTLFSYTGGIFTGPKPRGTDQKQYNEALNRWEHTNHAVVAVGWGEQEVRGKVEKFWIIRNSWGKTWGENGYFRIRRGDDECGIESMAVSFDVDPSVIMRG